MQGNATDATNLKNSIAIEPSNRIIAEINQNRYNNFDQDYVDDNESTYYGVNSINAEFLNQTFYKEMFPVSSVVNPIRPQQTGFSFFRQLPEDSSKRPYNVIRSVSSMNTYTSSTGNYGTVTGANLPQYFYNSTEKYYTPCPRLYYPGSGIKYKSYTKDSIKTSNGYWSDFSVDVKYQTSFWCNKISIGFDITGGPTGTVTIRLLASDGVTWSSPISATVDIYGRANLYRTTTGNISGAGSWTSTTPAYTNSYWNAGSDTISNATIIMGVRVSSVNNNGPVNLIEVKPSLVSDITHRLMTWSWDATLSEQDSFHPVGTVSSNSGSIDLFNSDESGNNLNMVMSKSNRSTSECRISEFSRQYCEIKSYVTVTPGSSVDIPNFSAFASSWTDGSDNKISAELTDLIGILQEMDAPEMMIEKASVSQVLWRIFDLAGVGPIKIKKSDSELPGAANYVAEDTVKVCWTEKDQNLWEFVKGVCSNFRYAVYVDESGYLNIATRNYIFDNSRSIDWTFYGQDSGTGPFADIINFEPVDKDILNTVTFKYAPIQSVSSDPDVTKGLGGGVATKVARITKTLWAAEGEVLLGRATLVQPLMAGDTDYIFVYNDVYVAPPQVTSWNQFSGYVLIDTEIIKFEGMQFSFPDALAGGNTAYATVSNKEEFQEVVSRSKGAVTFTGKLMGLTRGQFGTTDVSHTPAISTVVSTVTKAYVSGSDIVYETKNLFSIGDDVTITNITGFNASSKQVTAISSHKEVKITKAVNTDGSTNKYYSLNNLSVGDTVTITGFSSIFNQTNVKVLSATKTIFTTAGTTKGTKTTSTGKAVKTGYFKIVNSIGASGSANGTSSSKAARANLWSSTYAAPYTYSNDNSGKRNACVRVRNANGSDGAIYKSYRKLKRSDYNTFACNIRMATGNSGGMAIWSDNSSKGLFVQLSSSTDATKSRIHELSVTVRDGSGNPQVFKAETRFYPNKAANLSVAIDSPTSTTYRAKISLNGKKILTVRFAKSKIPAANKSGLALFSVGKSAVDFDYVVASNSLDVKTSYASIISRVLSTKFKPNTDLGFERYDFDNSVRSIYYEDIKFDKGPARNVFFIPYSNYDVKRARSDTESPVNARYGDVGFAISNQSPWHARIFLVGLSESPVLLGSGTTNYPFIYGEVYDKGQEQLVKKEDTSSIQRVGIKKFDGDLYWASDRSTVEKIAKNLLDISSNGGVSIKIDSFSNHLISIGDCVTINYINRGHEELETFIVAGIESSWDQGLKNTISVVRQIGV